MAQESKSPSSASILLWMCGGAASAGAFSLWPAFLHARGEVLESYIAISENPSPEALRTFLDQVLEIFDDAPNVVYLAMVFGALLAIPAGFMYRHVTSQPHKCSHRCATHHS